MRWVTDGTVDADIAVHSPATSKARHFFTNEDVFSSLGIGEFQKAFALCFPSCLMFDIPQIPNELGIQRDRIKVNRT
jgi:hypothetical protein